MSDYDVRMVVLSTDNLDESIKFYTETLGMSLKFRDGARYAALDGGSITLALATPVDHPMPGQVVVGIKTARRRRCCRGDRGQRWWDRQTPLQRRPRTARRGIRPQR